MRFLLLLPLVFAAGCAPKAPTPAPSVTAAQYAEVLSRLRTDEIELSGITNRLASEDLEQFILASSFGNLAASVTNRLRTLANRLAWQQVQASQFSTASIDPDSKHYVRLDTGICPLLISTEGAEPYLDGFKVKLQVGNPSLATFSGFTLVANWGRSYTNGADSLESWQSAQKCRTNEMADTLTAGAWTPVEVTLTPATAEELRQATVSIQLDAVLLHSKRPTE